MEAPWAKVEPSVQEMGVPMVLISAQEEVMGQLQVAYMAPMVIRSGLASLETWITTSWQCGCRRVCSVSWNPWTSEGEEHECFLAHSPHKLALVFNECEDRNSRVR